MKRKVKYDYEFKLRCIKEVVTKDRSVESVSKEFNCDESNIRKWASFYNKYGKTALIPKGNRTYDSNFKLKVLNSIKKNSLTLKEASLKYDIPSDSVIKTWQKNFAQEGIIGLNSKPRGRPKSMKFKRKKRTSTKPLTREEELLLENESLRAEIALLKKLQALIQAEESKKRKP